MAGETSLRGGAGGVAALCLIQFVDVLGVTVVVTALPRMLADVGGTSADGALVATGYAMFFGGLLMLGARLGDRVGNRRTVLLNIAVLTLVPPDRGTDHRTRLNLTGSVLLTAAVMLLVVAATLLGEEGRRLVGAVLLAGTGVLTAAFVVTDRRSAAPLLPVALVRTPQVLRGTAGSFMNTATTSVATLITLYLQGTLGRPALEAAATLLPLSLAVIVGAAAAGRMVLRRSREGVTAVGLALIGAGIALPLLVPASALLVGGGMALAGGGLGLSAVATTSMGTDVDEAFRATASGIINTSAQLGTAIGTALVLLVAAATTGVPDATTGTPVIAWAATGVLAVLAAGAFARLGTARVSA